MKPFFFVAVFLCLLVSCNNSNKITSGSESHKLKGTWQLNYITGPRIVFDGLYPNEKPTINFDVSGKRISGNTGCNTFSGTFDADGTKINFKEPLPTTKMTCPGEGESVFLRTLEKINTYDVTEGYTLSLLTDGVASMRFTKVK
jgi:heat shock protein HslJ